MTYVYFLSDCRQFTRLAMGPSADDDGRLGNREFQAGRFDRQKLLTPQFACPYGSWPESLEVWLRHQGHIGSRNGRDALDIVAFFDEIDEHQTRDNDAPKAIRHDRECADRN
jgi:hypothetical protein